jgi:hypothetical protein
VNRDEAPVELVEALRNGFGTGEGSL